MTSDQDIEFMRMALELAREGLGRVAPNPSVGCVIVNDGMVVGRARTADGGRPHAETQALEMAGDMAQGATVYVTLEPCFHEGETPSCARALIKAGVGRVIVSCTDPDPRTAGQGIAMLKEAGVEVTAGVLEEEARALNKGFFLKILEERPLIALKTATSADGKIAGGKERWVTGEEARAQAHVIRSCFDAILAGVGTVLADDPLLTTRTPGVDHNSIRVVMDTHLRTPPNSQLISSAAPAVPVIILHNANQGGVSGHALSRIKGVELMQADDLQDAMKKLAARGITRLLVEGGAKIHTSFVQAGLADEVFWFKAPKEIGAHGRNALEDGRWEDVVQNMDHEGSMTLGQDSLEIYSAKA